MEENPFDGFIDRDLQKRSYPDNETDSFAYDEINCIYIKGWKNFQHFKDRTPPWIKLYRGLLDDPDWFGLDDEAAKVLVMLWLIASEDKKLKGCLPCINKLSFRLRRSESETEQILSRLGDWLVFT